MSRWLMFIEHSVKRNVMSTSFLIDEMLCLVVKQVNIEINAYIHHAKPRSDLQN